jgi:nucleotide-binding universal stress UspA family protein
MFDRILVAVDGSSRSEHVLTTIIELARESKAEIRVVNVHEEHLAARAVPTGVDEDTAAASGIVGRALEQLGAAGVKASGAVRQSTSGRVGAEVVDEATEWGASLIALGTRGRTDLEGLLLGSVCHRVLHFSKIPVLVVPLGPT